MEDKSKYFVVKQKAVPEVLLKVVEAKKLLETVRAITVQEAADRVGISRSAFYKYRDAIRPFQDMLHGRIVTLQIMLRDEPGCLSLVLNLLAEMGANILTINQAIPGGGGAAVTVGMETSGLDGTVEDLMEAIGKTRGVIRCNVLAG